MVSNLFVTSRSIILCGTACKKPNDNDFASLLKPMMKDFEGITTIKDKNRNNKEFGLHYQVVNDGIACIGWIQMVREPGHPSMNALIYLLQTSAPGGFVKEQKEAAEYYANRVIKDYKEK